MSQELNREIPSSPESLPSNAIETSDTSIDENLDEFENDLENSDNDNLDDFVEEDQIEESEQSETEVHNLYAEQRIAKDLPTILSVEEESYFQNRNFFLEIPTEPKRSAKEFDTYYHHFVDKFLQKKQEKLEKKRKEIEETETYDTTHKPNLISKKLVPNHIPLYERVNIIKAKKEQEINRRKKELEQKMEKELNEFTFKPKINKKPLKSVTKDQSTISPINQAQAKQPTKPKAELKTPKKPVFQPNIDKKSVKIAKNVIENTSKNVVERLYVHAQTNYEKNKQKLLQQSLPDFKPRLLTTAYNRNKTSAIRSKTPEASQGWFEANKSRITQEENMKQPQNGNPLPYSSMSRSKTPDYQSNKLEISKENKRDAEEAIEPKKSSSIDLEKLEKLFSYCSNLNKKEEIEIQVIEETTLEDNVTQQVTKIEADIEDINAGEGNVDKVQEEVKEDKNECLIQNEISIEKEEVQKEKCEEIENPVDAPYREEEEVYSFRSESTQSIIKSLLDTSTKKQNEKSIYFEGEVDDTEIDSFKQNLLDLSKNLQMLKDSFKNFQSTQRPSKTELFSQENVEPEKQNISKSKRKKSRKNSKQEVIQKEALFSNSILNNSVKERRGSIQSSHISVKRDSKPKSPNKSRQSAKNESNVLAIRKSNTMEASKISRGSAKYEKYDYESENNVCRSLFRDECSSISLESTHQGALSFSIQDSASNTYKEQTFRPHGPGEFLNKNIQSDSLSFKKYTHENEPLYRDPIGIISINKPDDVSISANNLKDIALMTLRKFRNFDR